MEMDGMQKFGKRSIRGFLCFFGFFCMTGDRWMALPSQQKHEFPLPVPVRRVDLALIQSGLARELNFNFRTDAKPYKPEITSNMNLTLKSQLEGQGRTTLISADQ